MRKIMKYRAEMKVFLRMPVILSSALLLLWMALNAQTLFGNQHGGIRFVLTTLFALLILLRPKPASGPDSPPAPRLSPALTSAAAVAGTIAVVLGLMIPIRQMEWIGLLLLVYACLTAALPPAFTRDVPLALAVLYWASPLPHAIFGFLQTAMQTASVRGSEWLLHLANTRVWADGILLRTGTRVFEVPEWCSGMQTASTVFILSLALGILRRLRPLEILLFIGWSLAHALVLNILRISAMIYLVPRLYPDQAGLAFLHDTAGLFLLGGVFLVYIELLVLDYARQRRQDRLDMLQAALDGGLSEYPPFWHRVLRRGGAVFALLALLAASGTAIIAWRSRPYHRTMMLRDVAGGLRDSGDLTNARRLAGIVATRCPDDLEWRLSAIRMDLISGHAQEVLEALVTLAELPPPLQMQRRILQAYALLHLDRLDEAAAIVEEIPGPTRRTDPRMAMILAEMAVRARNADAAATHIRVAARWAPNMDRIRQLYPWLRLHRQWEAMAASDVTVPYRDPIQAFSILEAFMNQDNRVRIASITLDALTRWPDDPRLLEPLFFMAVRSGGEWEGRFRDLLLKTLPSVTSPETIHALLHKCFLLNRPDLAWTLCVHLTRIAPGHPVLSMAAVEYGDRWFTFRSHHLGMTASSPSETMDLKPYFLLGTLLPGWESLTGLVPLGAELSASDTLPVRKAFLRQALAAFAERIRNGDLSPGLQILHAQALEQSGRLDLARAQLDLIAVQAPEQAPTVKALLAEMYARKGAWIQVYETLRTCSTSGLTADADDRADVPAWPPVPSARRPDRGSSPLQPLRRLAEALLELRLPLAAEFTAREAVRLYPRSPHARALLAAALMRIGDAETALPHLAIARRGDGNELDILEAEALMATQRFGELNEFCRRRSLPSPRIPSGTIQDIALPPAELALLRHRTFIPAEAEFAGAAATLRENLSTAGNGLRPLLALWIEAWENHGEGSLADPSRWIAVARDRVEQAIALNQLTLLLCREGRAADALPAARLAVAALPESAQLWQWLISLDGGDPETIALARRFCPEDADLWLADLVTRTRPGGHPPVTGEEWLLVRNRVNILLDDTLAGSAIHPAGLARAADYLQRGGLYDEAGRLASVLAGNARGLLPAYIPAIRSALRSRDRSLALHATTLAIAAALSPPPFLYEDLVILKAGEGNTDSGSEIINALRALRQSDPDHPLWSQMLGYLRFQRGGWEILDSLAEMNSAIASGATNQTPFLISAEVYRQLRNYDRAADTLRRALELHPGNPVLINNLAYTLVHDEKHLAEAISLIPALEAAAESDPRIRDTLSIVHLRAGDLERARASIIRTLRDASPGSPLWFRCQTHLAEIAWRQGHDQSATSMLEQLLRNTRNIPDDDILAANTLFSRITTPPPATRIPGSD